jgi:hypothetical protein
MERTFGLQVLIQIFVLRLPERVFRVTCGLDTCFKELHDLVTFQLPDHVRGVSRAAFALTHLWHLDILASFGINSYASKQSGRPKKIGFLLRKKIRQPAGSISFLPWPMGSYLPLPGASVRGMEKGVTTDDRELRSIMCQTVATLFAFFPSFMVSSRE